MMKKEKKVSSLSGKLTRVIISVVAIMIILLVLLSYSISKKMIKQYSEDLLLASIESQSDQILAFMNENLYSFQIVKATLEGMNLSDNEMTEVLDLYYGFNSAYPEGIYIGTEEGELFQAEKGTKSDVDVCRSNWYKQGLSHVNMRFGTAYINDSGKSIVTASGILNDNSEKIRVIAADLPLDHVSIIVNSAIQMKNAESILVDMTDGTILASRNTEMIYSVLDENGNDMFFNAVAEKLKSQEYEMVELCDRLVAFEKIPGTDWILVSYVSTDSIYEGVNTLRTIMIIVGLISIIILAILVNVIVHMVIKPVNELTESIASMTKGDFTIDIRSRGNDEIAFMCQKLKDFVESMRVMISDINNVSGNLGEEAVNSKKISGEMYAASKVQAESMEKLNVTVDQISLSVNEIAQTATMLAAVVSETKNDSVNAEYKMKETIKVSEKGHNDIVKIGEAMTNIKSSIGKLEVSINKVGKASEDIQNIISVIGNIAEETNLLSLNASIEAARAGEAGRGFAVVATEIGNLAKTSSESVQNIGTLITEVKALIEDAVFQAGDSVQNISESTELVHTAVDTFQIIFDNIQQTNEVISSVIKKIGTVDDVATTVAAISEEQAASTDEILEAADNVVRHTEQMIHNSKTVADSAEELQKTSEKLDIQVQMFKI